MLSTYWKHALHVKHSILNNPQLHTLTPHSCAVLLTHTHTPRLHTHTDFFFIVHFISIWLTPVLFFHQRGQCYCYNDEEGHSAFFYHVQCPMKLLDGITFSLTARGAADCGRRDETARSMSHRFHTCLAHAEKWAGPQLMRGAGNLEPC